MRTARRAYDGNARTTCVYFIIGMVTITMGSEEGVVAQQVIPSGPMDIQSTLLRTSNTYERSSEVLVRADIRKVGV